MKQLYLLDGSNILFRSFHAIGHMTNPEGAATNALFGFARTVISFLREFPVSHMLIAFDGPTSRASRLKIYSEYKATRGETPPDIKHQFVWAQQFCQLMGIPMLVGDGVEADDVLGSCAAWAASQGVDCFIVSSDKDLAQLVGDHVRILLPHKNMQVMDAAGVKENFGVEPSQIVDYLAIVGDTSDNIPGLPGFGPKTASSLLAEFGSLGVLLENCDKVAGKKKQETLRERSADALVSRLLAKIHTDVPIEHAESYYALKEPERAQLMHFFAQMNFKSLLKEAEGMAAPKPVVALSKPVLVDSEASFSAMTKALQGDIAVSVLATVMLPRQGEVQAIGCKSASSCAFIVRGAYAEKLAHYLEGKALFGHNMKAQMHKLRSLGLQEAQVVFDAELASYLLSPSLHQHSLSFLASEYLSEVKESLDGDADAYLAQELSLVERLRGHLEPLLVERELSSLYHNIELPLSHVLLGMEERGIYLDAEALNHYGVTVRAELAALTQEVYRLSGGEFNLNSPKQLAHVLFEQMGLEPPKKAKVGATPSVAADVLEELKEQPIVAAILRYRSLEKLRSTYIEPLVTCIVPETGRIHCQFLQTVAATGRLSSQDPNLQNIPVRTEAGLEIRAAFKPQKPGYSFLACDYSQIELRLLAHMSEDATLLKAFLEGEDIHKATASLVFGVPLDEVTSQQRYQAKAVNFGILYGQGPFGLSQQLGIDQKTAQKFIHTYFERLPGVQVFIEKCKQEARDTGYSSTLFGRRRPIADLHSTNGMLRQAAERLAVNTPLQGSQADIIKMAMLKIEQRLAKAQLDASLILQIHDELIFEVADKDVVSLQELATSCMSGVASLKVPLTVDSAVGKNWKEC